MSTICEADSPCVLVVEDDSAAIRLYEEAFRELEAPVDVSVVTDGKQALDVLHRRGEYVDAGVPDIVIHDLDLPEVGGRAVLRELHEVGLLPALPVVVCSQRTGQETIDECYRLGASAYFVKPDDYDGLLRIARRVSAFWGTNEIEFPSS